MSEPGRLQRACAGLLAAVALGLAGLGVEGRQLRWVLWTDRDLWRAQVTPFATTGPELSFGSGGRIPGGGVQLLLAPLVALTHDPLWIWRAVAVGIALGLVALGLLLRRPLGGLAAAVTMLGVMVSDVVPDALWTIWNPALLGPFALLAWGAWVRVVHDRDGRALPWLTASLAIGAQLHASTALLAAALLVPVLLARPTVTRAQLALAIGLPLLAYAPHLVDEALHGWPNTRLLLEQGAGVPPQPPGLLGRNVHGAAMGLAGPNPRPATPTFLEAAGLAGVVSGLRWALVLVGVVAALRPGADAARRRTTLGALGVVLVVGGLVVTSSFDLTSGTTRRFFVGVLPGFALLGGLGADALVRALDRRRLGGLAVLAISALLVTQAAATEERWRKGSGSWGTWTNLADLLARVQEATGWSLPEVAGRTVLVAGGHGRGWGQDWFPVDGIDALLAMQGASFPGSLRGDCVVLFPFVPREAPPLDAAILARALRTDPARVHLQEATRTDAGHVIARYDLGGDPCPTSLVDRYVPTPAVLAARPAAATLPVGGTAELPGPAGARRVVLRATSTYGDVGERPLVWVVDLEPGPGRLDATLDADQLRGHSYNGGDRVNVLVAGPRLVLTGPGGEIVAPFAEGTVGHLAAVTPLSTSVVLPAGTWRVALAWDDVVLPERRPAPVEEAPRRVPQALPLLDDLVVP